MTFEQVILVLLGALAGGLVNGLTGFGTGITAMGLWLYAVSPSTAASLVIICSFTAQVLTLPMIWRTINWSRVLPFVVPGLLGVPVGTWILPHVDATDFKIGIGAFLIAYSTYVLTKVPHGGSTVGGRPADTVIGFGGGILGGLTGLAGVLNVIWTDVRGWTKDERRSVLQGFNISILAVALVSHALSGLLTRDVGYATAAALPGTIGGAWIGALIYRRLGDRGYQRIVVSLLLVAGIMLIVTSLT